MSITAPMEKRIDVARELKLRITSMVSSEVGGRGTKVILTSYPSVEGLELGTTKLSGRCPNLVPEKSNVPANEKIGLY